ECTSSFVLKQFQSTLSRGSSRIDQTRHRQGRKGQQRRECTSSFVLKQFQSTLSRGYSRIDQTRYRQGRKGGRW
ncbi:Uncharacterized protein APZ42_008059, partial [Daphnia magna]